MQGGFNAFQVSLACFVVLFMDALTSSGAETMLHQHHWLYFPSGASVVGGPTFCNKAVGLLILYTLLSGSLKSEREDSIHGHSVVQFASVFVGGLLEAP